MARVDAVASVPLFLVEDDGRRYFTDDISELCMVMEPARRALQTTGYLSAIRTADGSRSVTMLPPGSCWQDGVLEGGRWPLQEERDSATSIGGLVDAWCSEMLALARRLVDAAGRGHIIVPVSGGYDSRALVLALRLVGAGDQVVMVTYGAPELDDRRIAESFAETLNLRIRSFDVDEEFWETNLRRPYSGLVATCVRHALSRGSSVHLQEIPMLARIGKLDGMVVPGHSMDFLAGSHLMRFYTAGIDIDRAGSVAGLADGLSVLGADSSLASRYAAEFEAAHERPIESVSAGDVLEWWDWVYRQSRWVLASTANYDAAGLAWSVPYWWKSVFDFWARVPNAARWGTMIHRSAVKRLALDCGVELQVTWRRRSFDYASTRRTTRTMARCGLAAWQRVRHPGHGYGATTSLTDLGRLTTHQYVSGERTSVR